MRTNRDLYVAIAKLIKEKKEPPTLSLEAYLTSLWWRGVRRSDQPHFSLEEFHQLLVDAFTEGSDVRAVEPPALEEEEAEGFPGWEALMRRQITDLRTMASGGLLAGPDGIFGVQVSGGGFWYNLDPLSFLECGVEGCWDGWEPGDDTGRFHVPGKVAVMDEEGDWSLCDPQDISSPHVVIETVSWDDFKRFLYCGQNYE